MSYVFLKTLNSFAIQNRNNVSPIIRRKYLLALITNRWITGGKTSKTTEEMFDEPYGKVLHPEYMDKPPKAPRTVRDFAEPHRNKNWLSFGYDFADRENDTYLMHLFTFGMITCLSIYFPFTMWYMPDWMLNNWSTREAYLQIAKREKLGLPHIDKELVDPKLMVLPTEEELEGLDVYL